MPITPRTPGAAQPPAQASAPRERFRPGAAAPSAPAAAPIQSRIPTQRPGFGAGPRTAAPAVSGQMSGQRFAAPQHPQQTQQSGWLSRGSAMREALERESQKKAARDQERANRVFQPSRFFLKSGETAELIILDEHIDHCPQVYEWDLTWEPRFARKDARGKNRPLYELSPQMVGEIDPIASELGKDPTFVVYMTVIDMRPITRENGTVEPYRRKLLPIKHRDVTWFTRKADQYGGRLRGMHLIMSRDNKDQSKIGIPDQFVRTDGPPFYTEEEILEAFGHPPVLDRNNREIEPANAYCYPVNYDEVFPTPSAERLRALYNRTPPLGAGGSYAASGGMGQSGGGWSYPSGAAAGGASGVDHWEQADHQANSLLSDAQMHATEEDGGEYGSDSGEWSEHDPAAALGQAGAPGQGDMEDSGVGGEIDDEIPFR